MPSAVETLPDTRVRLTVDVSAHDVDHAFEHAISDLSSQVKIAGFRKGKVPKNVLRQRLGEDAIIEEALRGHLNSWTGRALVEHDLEAVSQPEIAWDDAPVEGRPWRFTATLHVPPPATLPEPLALEAARPEVDVTEEDIERQLEILRSSASQLAPVEEAPAEAGMAALVDITCVVDGRTVKEASTTDHMVQLGADQLVDELEAAIVGLRPGESADVEFPLPENAPKKVAGKPATWTVQLKELKRQVLPELDDDLAQAVSEFDTFAELRADVEQSMRGVAERRNDAAYRGAVLAALGRAATVAVPDSMIARRVDERIRSLQRSLAARGVDLERYLQMTGMSGPMLIAQLRPEAEAAAREELALRALADREQVTVSDAELEEFVRESTAEEQDPEEAARTILGNDNARRSLTGELRLKKALDRAVELTTPITPEQAEAREKLWTPGKESEGTAPAEIWTPGS